MSCRLKVLHVDIYHVASENCGGPLGYQETEQSFLVADSKPLVIDESDRSRNTIKPISEAM